MLLVPDKADGVALASKKRTGGQGRRQISEDLFDRETTCKKLVKSFVRRADVL